MSTNSKINLILISLVLLSAGVFFKPAVKSFKEQKSLIEVKSKAVALGYFLPDFSRLAEVLSQDEAGPIESPGRYLDYYSKAAEIFPHLVNAPSLLGFFYAQSGAWEEALAAYEKAVSANPHYFWNYYNLALAYHHLGRYEASNKAIALALEQKPDVAMVIINKSPEFRQIWRHLSDPQQVITQNIKKGYQDCLALMVLNNYLSGNFQQVLSVSSKAIQSDFNQKDIHLYYAGVASHKLGQNEVALMLIQAFISVHDNNVQAWNYLGKALEAIGKTDLAREANLKAAHLKQFGHDDEPQFNLPLRIL